MSTGDLLKDIRDIYGSLQDSLSRELYIARLDWLATGDLRYIGQIVEKSHPDVPVWNGRQEKDFLEMLPEDTELFFYGAGSFATRLIPYLDGWTGTVRFCDRDEDKQEKGFYGYRVASPEEMFREDRDKKIVICTTRYHQGTKRYLIENGIPEEDIIDIRAFFKCGTGDDYFYEDFLHYDAEEVFIDAGCCDLATTVDLARLCRGLRKVYAFEPDVANHRRCMERIEEEGGTLPKIVMLPYGTWSGTAELRFDQTADGCSHIGEGDAVIRAAAIDDIVDPRDRITFIKMDVEGAELESLKGAQKVIRRDRPKLAVCIYHKPEDMITLPQYIRSLVPEYRFYLRSYSNADNEMVLYAVL